MDLSSPGQGEIFDPLLIALLLQCLQRKPKFFSTESKQIHRKRLLVELGYAEFILSLKGTAELWSTTGLL
jgi:hypothetical protein